MLVKRNKMRNKVVLAMVVIMATGITYFAFAAEHPTGGMMGKDTMGKEMMGKGMGMMGMCPMHSMTCGAMMKGEITATQDGGIVVMCCNKLYKYDKDLNMVKSVEMKEVQQDCKTMMETMKKECMEKCQMMKTERPAGEKM
jgi:hypothetical protein